MKSGLSIAVFCVAGITAPGTARTQSASAAGIAQYYTVGPDDQVAAFSSAAAANPSHRIQRSRHPRPLPRANRMSDHALTWQNTSYSNIAALMTAARITGAVVLKDGEIVYENYALGRRRSDQWLSFSVAKSVTSLLAGAAVQDGKIGSLNDRVVAYLPELRGSAYDAVTVRQLLSMTSGVKWSEAYGDPQSDVVKIKQWRGDPGMPPVVSYMRRLPRVAPPGQVFAYKTGETDLAGALISRAVGMNLADYLSRKIWGPYGMEGEAAWLTDGGSLERGGCCLNMLLRDYARLGQFVLDGGRAGGRQVIAPGYLAASTTNQLPGADDHRYGYFWWVHPDGSYSAQGIFGQLIRISPRHRLVVAINSAWWPDPVDPKGVEAWEAIFAAFAPPN
ncbi:MAG: serine hydrolase domain-containing protein [Novosphingobium sp.]